MRILVCDDELDPPRAAIEKMSRAGVEDGGDEVVVAAHVRTARAAFKSVATTKFDVVLIDLFLPIKFVSDRPNPPTGPWLARAIVRAYPDLQAPLVMWTPNVASTLEHRNQSRAFVHHGGTQIMDKVSTARAQRRTLEAALAHETWQPPPDELTEAEREVLAYHAAGYNGEEIGSRTSRETSTVEGYTTAIRRKLLGSPAPPETARGFGPLLAAAATAGRSVSWLPIEHLGEPPDLYAEITKG